MKTDFVSTPSAIHHIPDFEFKVKFRPGEKEGILYAKDPIGVTRAWTTEGQASLGLKESKDICDDLEVLYGRGIYKKNPSGDALKIQAIKDLRALFEKAVHESKTAALLPEEPELEDVSPRTLTINFVGGSDAIFEDVAFVEAQGDFLVTHHSNGQMVFRPGHRIIKATVSAP